MACRLLDPARSDRSLEIERNGSLAWVRLSAFDAQDARDIQRYRFWRKSLSLNGERLGRIRRVEEFAATPQSTYLGHFANPGLYLEFRP